MRFLILVGHDEKAGIQCIKEDGAKLYASYKKYTDDLNKAGVLLGGEALKPSAIGARITADGGKKKVVDGPFSESKEIIGGYFLIQVKSKEEALEWAARCPAAQLGTWSYAELREVEEIPS